MKFSKPVGAIFLAGLIGIHAVISVYALTSDAQASNATSVPAAALELQNPPAPRFSPGTQEILKMLDAKVDIDVIKAYIKNSTVAYSPSAAEIIALKQRGVPDEVVAALLQRGAEVRAQAVSPGPVAPVAAPTAPAPYAPYADMAPYASDYYDYGSPYYVGYPYAYPYSYNYWWYNYGYPWGLYSSFYYPYYGHHYYHGYHGYGHYYGHSGDFRGRAGYHGGYGPYRPNSAPFGTFAGRSAGFSGNRGTSPFGTFAPHRNAFATGSGASRPMMGFSGGRPGSFAAHTGGFRSGGGGFGGRGGGGGHR